MHTFVDSEINITCYCYLMLDSVGMGDPEWLFSRHAMPDLVLKYGPVIHFGHSRRFSSNGQKTSASRHGLLSYQR